MDGFSSCPSEKRDVTRSPTHSHQQRDRPSCIYKPATLLAVLAMHDLSVFHPRQAPGLSPRSHRHSLRKTALATLRVSAQSSQQGTCCSVASHKDQTKHTLLLHCVLLQLLPHFSAPPLQQNLRWSPVSAVCHSSPLVPITIINITIKQRQGHEVHQRLEGQSQDLT